jgi:hypothetical protein
VSAKKALSRAFAKYTLKRPGKGKVMQSANMGQTVMA